MRLIRTENLWSRCLVPKSVKFRPWLIVLTIRRSAGYKRSVCASRICGKFIYTHWLNVTWRKHFEQPQLLSLAERLKVEKRIKALGVHISGWYNMPNTALSWRKINYAPIGRQAEEKLPKKKKMGKCGSSGQGGSWEMWKVLVMATEFTAQYWKLKEQHHHNTSIHKHTHWIGICHHKSYNRMNNLQLSQQSLIYDPVGIQICQICLKIVLAGYWPGKHLVCWRAPRFRPHGRRFPCPMPPALRPAAPFPPRCCGGTHRTASRRDICRRNGIQSWKL